jgi:hypothetical protein
MFHDQISEAAARPGFVHGCDVRVAQPRENAAFAIEALREARRGRVAAVERRRVGAVLGGQGGGMQEVGGIVAAEGIVG